MHQAAIIRVFLLFTIVVGATWCARVSPVAATEQAEADAGNEVTEAGLEQRRKEAQESTELNEETKKKVLDSLEQALQQLRRVTELTGRAAELKAAAESAPARAAELSAQLMVLKNRTPRAPDKRLLWAVPLPGLQQQLAEQDLALSEHKAALAKAESELANRVHRRKEIRAALQAGPERLTEVARQLDAPAPPNESPAIAPARRAELLTHRRLIEVELPALQNELARYEAEDAVSWLQLERDVLAHQIRFAQEEHQLLSEYVKQRRAQAALEALRKAEEEAIQAEPLLRDLAERNEELARQSQALSQLIPHVEQNRKSAAEKLNGLRKQFAQTKLKVDSVGLTSAVGMMLRKQQAALPDVRQTRADVRARQRTINDGQFALLEYDEERVALVDTDDVISQVLEASNLSTHDVRYTRLETSAHKALERKAEYLDSLIRNYNTYFDALVELDATERNLITLVTEYDTYINERVLWIPSNTPLLANTPLSGSMRFDRTDAAFLEASTWLDIGRRLRTDVFSAWLYYLLASAAWGVLFARQRRLRSEIAELGELVASRTCCDFRPTLRTAALTGLIASVWPAPLLFLGWRLGVAANGEALTGAVAYGLRCVALIVFPLEILRQICRPGGLAEAHFQWTRTSLQTLRRSLKFLMIFGAPLLLVSATFFMSEPVYGLDLPERIGFIAALALLAWFCRTVLSPSTGVLREYAAYHAGGWVDRLQHFAYWAAIGVPLVLCALAFWGYYYTARQLTWRLYISCILVGGLILIRVMLLRWVLVRRRKLAIEQARRRRSTQSETHLSGGLVATTTPDLGAPQPIDLTKQTAQTQRLLSSAVALGVAVGVWMIWVEMIPALSILDRWSLWTTTVQVTESVPVAGEAGAVQTRTRDVVEKITLADLGLAALIAATTLVACRNVPGLLEMSLLQRLPLESSVRYAITSLASYTIVLVGLVITFKTVGLQWSQIQWLATALTFGLAFGLQEIFANFVAGLIILFERPIRVGDVVTVDEVSGVVSRVRIRATTITNWDRKEFVVPNKEFITGRILNWTLSDQVNRVVITVGVAYGSDTDKACELLSKAANDHPLVLKSPPAMATFEGFGDNSLNCTLRAFLPSLENRLVAIHELHTAIDRLFREAGIEIAFPQREFHIRSLPEPLQQLLSSLTIGDRTPSNRPRAA